MGAEDPKKSSRPSWLNGRCLCGGVRFRIRAPGALVFCHCSQCRKAQGAAFASNLPVALEDFELERGEALLTDYRSSADKTRRFCRRCASPIYSRRDGATTLRIRAGLLVNVDIEVHAHIFAHHAPRWAPIGDRLPRFAGFEPDRR